MTASSTANSSTAAVNMSLTAAATAAAAAVTASSGSQVPGGVGTVPWLELARSYIELAWNYWLSWLLTPIILAFAIPLILCLLLYITSTFAYAYQHGIFRRLMKAASERDLERVGRTVIATLWLVMGQLWFGYEVHGLDNLPPDGYGALLVYYHGALPVDYYFFLAWMTVHRQRTPLSVVDLFLFKIPGMGTILKMFRCTPGTVEGCSNDIIEGNLLGLAPGGVHEAQFSDHKYKVLWKNRVGFSKIALKAKAPVIPIFTRNIREAFRTVSTFRGIFIRIYNKIRFPCVPLYGGFPVKLQTFIGKPIEHDPSDTPFTLRKVSEVA